MTNKTLQEMNARIWEELDIYDCLYQNPYGHDHVPYGKVVAHIGSCMQWIEENIRNKCPVCGGEVQYEEGQQTFPETGQRDFPAEMYCFEGDDCERAEKTNPKGREMFYTEGLSWDILDVRPNKSQPLPLPTEEVGSEWKDIIEFLFSLIDNHE